MKPTSPLLDNLNVFVTTPCRGFISFSLGPMAHPDLDALLNDLLPFAQQMLAKHGEFYPFGGSITIEDKHVSVGAKGESDHPKSQQLIDLLTQAFRRDATTGQIRAAGICFDVRVVPSGQTASLHTASCLHRSAHLNFSCNPTRRSNQTMKPAAPVRGDFSV